MSDLLELADRCEREAGSFALEVAIAKAIGAYSTPPRNYTVSIDAAAMLVPAKFARSWRIEPKRARLSHHDEKHHGKGQTPALALCAAALRARAQLGSKP